IHNERSDQPAFHRHVLWLATGKHQQKREKDAGPHVFSTKKPTLTFATCWWAVASVAKNLAIRRFASGARGRKGLRSSTGGWCSQIDLRRTRLCGEGFLGQRPGLAELLRAHFEVCLSVGNALFDLCLCSTGRGLRLILQRLHPRLGFSLRLVQPCLGLVLD